MFDLFFSASETRAPASHIAILAEKSFPIQTNKGFLTVVGAEFEKVILYKKILLNFNSPLFFSMFSVVLNIAF